MPLYEFHYSCDLSSQQRATLASIITRSHCEFFKAASIFVNVVFKKMGEGEAMFVGGREVSGNCLIAHLRPRKIATTQLQTLLTRLMRTWTVTVHSPSSSGPRPSESTAQRLDDPYALHTIFLLEDISAGAEQGMIIPPAGQDQKWAEQHIGEIRERGQQGEKSMQRFEREVGWGLGNEWETWRIGVGGWETEELEIERKRMEQCSQ